MECIKNNVIFLGDFNFVKSKIDTKNQHLFKITKEKVAFKKLKKKKIVLIYLENIRQRG